MLLSLLIRGFATLVVGDRDDGYEALGHMEGRAPLIGALAFVAGFERLRGGPIARRALGAISAETRPRNPIAPIRHGVDVFKRIQKGVRRRRPSPESVAYFAVWLLLLAWLEVSWAVAEWP